VDDLFTEDFKSTPYWADTAPRPVLDSAALPRAVDVAVVGAGYTGLAAALELARAGRSVAVLDAGDPGIGCSGRNGGQASVGLKGMFDTLAARHGEPPARAMVRMGIEAYDRLRTFITEEAIACDFKASGHFKGAHAPGQFEPLRRSAERQMRAFGIEAYPVSRSEQRAEAGTDAYHGGVVFPGFGGLDPAKLHAGLLDRAQVAGTRVLAHTRVRAIEREKSGWRLETPAGALLAANVVVATNGYTGRATPWLQRRIVPVGSYQIATAPIPAALMDRLSPRDRMMQETRKVVFYFRPSPDRTRLLFGGRVATGEIAPERAAVRLHAEMVRRYPELAGTRVSHAWGGFVAFTFDGIPHIGEHDGVHYAMGYCGSGVSLSLYLGHKLGRRLLGHKDGATPLDAVTFPTRPLYSGRPWFLGAAVAWYRLLDRMAR
jgi:glycine/D-amino acid oxidase-like deaminating enzyme